MDLHRQPGTPQWELVEPHKRNKWQQRAAETNGWDTPANRISAIGLASTLTGLYLTTKKGFLPKAVGIGLLGFGRWQDLRDGKKAEETGTKSPMGEAVDASVDKAGIAAAVAANFKSHAIPTTEMVAHGAQQSGNAILTFIAKAKGNEIHPGLLGKLGTGGIWVSTGTHLVASAVGELGYETASKNLHTAGSVMNVASLAVNVAGMFMDYVPPAFGSNPDDIPDNTIQIFDRFSLVPKPSSI